MQRNEKMIKEIIKKLEEINNIEKENEKINKKTYFEIHWKPHPWMKWIKF